MSSCMLSYLVQVGKSWIFNPLERPFHPDDENMLFIGNSYTGYNHLPELVLEALEAGSGINPLLENQGRVHVERHTPPGETFAGHWKGLDQGDTFSRFSFDYYYRSHHLQRWLLPSSDGNTVARHWKWITLQNHSVQAGFFKSQDDKKKAIFDESLQAAQNINKVITQHCPSSKTLFILTWGRLGRNSGNPELYGDYLTMQELLLEGYQIYVKETSTPSRPTYLAPVGLVFRTIYNDLMAAGHEDPTQPGTDSLFYDLYDKGDHHPSLAGSYVYALTVYATMTGKEVHNLDWVPDGLDADKAKTLRDAVSRTIQETVEAKIIRYPWQEHQ